MRLGTKTAAILTISLVALLTGCNPEQTEKDTLAEAQFCLDKATDAAAVDACMSKIEGITSEEAYALRCAGGFIASGITQPENLSIALNSMKQNGSTASVLGVLAFSSVAAADATFSDCNQSGNNGLALLAAMTKTATALNALIDPNLGGTIEQNFQATITNLVADLQGGDQAAKDAALAEATKIGGTIQTVYQASCGGTVAVNTEMCGSIDGAIAASGGAVDINSLPADIGAALLQYWQTN